MVFVHLHQRCMRSRMQTALLYAIISGKICPGCTLWSREQNEDFWFKTLSPHQIADDSVKKIRTSWEARVYICQEKAQYFQIASTSSFIFTSYRTILNLLGLGKWPVCMIVNSTVKTIFQNLIRRFIYLCVTTKYLIDPCQIDTLLGYVQLYKGCFCS